MTDCPKCQSEMKTLKGKYTNYRYCDSCYQHFTYAERVNSCCHNETPVIVLHTISNGAEVLRFQCNACGEIKPASLKKKNFDLTKIPRSDIEKDKAKHEYSRQEFIDLNQRYNAKRKELFFDQYGLYLKSAIWKKKRELVLQRDNYQCQSCLSARATEVHHTSYAHLYNEPLFDLVAVCSPCHEIITAQDRKEVNVSKIKHT